MLALPPPFENARTNRLRFAVFNLPARLFSHARKLLARVAPCLLERAGLLVGRVGLRATSAPTTSVRLSRDQDYGSTLEDVHRLGV